MSDASPNFAYPKAPEWCVHLEFDGWIYASCQNDLRRSGEVTGRDWMRIVSDEVAARGGFVYYSLDVKDEVLPAIVQDMINYMADALETNLKYEPNLDPPDPPDDPDLTVLMRKSREGDLAWVDDLLSRHVPLEDVDKDGCTALMHAVFAGQVEVVERLLDAGADPNHQTAKGNSTLVQALEVRPDQYRPTKRYDIMRLLLSHGANPNLYVGWGRTVMDLCYVDDPRAAHIIRDFGGLRAKHLKRFWSRWWFQYPVGIGAASVCAWLTWRMLTTISWFDF